MPPQPFVILATPRTGSWHLVALLNQHPNIVSNGEILNPDDTSWKRPERLKMSDEELLNYAFVDFPVSGPKTKVLAVGCKILDEQVSGPGRASFLERLASWPGLRVIVLRRVNLLEALRSNVQAAAMGRWGVLVGSGKPEPPPRISLTPEMCSDFFTRAERFYERVGSRFGGLPRLDLSYEELSDNTPAALKSACEFLGVPPLTKVVQVWQKLETRPLSEAVLNFEELRSYFAGTPYQAFFA